MAKACCKSSKYVALALQMFCACQYPNALTSLRTYQMMSQNKSTEVILQYRNIGVLDDIISCSILIFVPAIGGSNGEVETRCLHLFMIFVDPVIEIDIGQTRGRVGWLIIETIETLGPHSDSIDCRRIFFGVFMELINLVLERFSPTNDMRTHCPDD